VTIGCNDRCTVTPEAITNGQQVGLREHRLVVDAGETRRFALRMSPRRIAQLQRARARHLRLRMVFDSRIGPQRVLTRTVALPPPPKPKPKPKPKKAKKVSAKKLAAERLDQGSAKRTKPGS
jgi:hypothetical protein